jgi:hypothetical protein
LEVEVLTLNGESCADFQSKTQHFVWEAEMQISESDAKKALQVLGPTNKNAKEIEKNADLLNLFVGIVNASLAAMDGKTASEKGLSATLGLIDKHASIAGFTGKQNDIKALILAGNAIQISTQTLSLLKLGANASPGAVVATLGAMFTKKVSLALGLVENNKQAKMMEVTADCAASLFSLGGMIVAGVSGPVGWVLLGAALAQTGASAYQAYAAAQQA